METATNPTEDEYLVHLQQPDQCAETWSSSDRAIEPATNLRVLLIAPYPVLPASSGGKIRIVQLASELSRRGCDVTILAPFKPGQWRSFDDSYGFDLREVRYPFLLPVALLDRPLPYGYLVSFHPGYAANLKQFLHSFDVYQFEHPFFGDLVKLLPPGRPIIYDAHNVEFDYVRDECKQPGVRNFVGKRIYRLEKQLARSASRVLVCSQGERSRLRELYGVPTERTVVMPNGIKRVHGEPSAQGKAALLERFPGLARFQRCAVYTGSNVEHNRRAVRMIIEQLAPQLKDECGFVIHGTVATAFMNRTYDNVFFDDSFGGLGPYAVPGMIGLNAVSQGGGTNLKLIQYLAHGMAVVSTEFGVRGYDDLLPYLTVSSIDGFADALRSGPTLDPAVNPILKNYLWREIAADLKDTYLEICGNGTPVDQPN